MKNILCLTLIIGLITLGAFLYFEPETTSAAEASGTSPQSLTAVASLTVNAEISLSITSTSISLAPNLTMTVNTATGVGVWNVKTNNLNGWSLTLQADRANALYNTASTSVAFTDYTNTGQPTAWSVSSAYKFGFTVFGSSVDTTTWGTGTGCGTPSSSSLKYLGFNSTTATTVTISNSYSNQATTTSGVNTTMCLAAEQNSVYAPSGSYQANITATALVQ